MLGKEFLDAEDSRVVNKVSSAPAGSAPGALGVGPQGDAVVHVWEDLFLKAAGGGERGQVLCITPLDPTCLAVNYNEQRERAEPKSALANIKGVSRTDIKTRPALHSITNRY